MALDPTALAAWRKSRGRVGVQALPEAMPEGTPFTLVVDFSGLTELVTRGVIHNPLIDAALAGLDEAKERIGDAAATDVQPGLLTARWQAQRANEQWADAILAAFIVEPRYYRLDELGAGGCPDDGICLFDLPDERRGPLVDLAIGGWEALEPFREKLRSLAAVGDGGAARPEAEQLDADAEPAPSVLAGSSPVHGPTRAGAAAGRGPRAVPRAQAS